MSATLLMALGLAMPSLSRPLPPLAERPVLLWSETCIDVGDVPRGTILRHSFEVCNLSEVPVVLDVRRCCGQQAQDERVLWPGAVETIRFHVDTSRLRGPVLKTAHVATDPPARHVTVGAWSAPQPGAVSRATP